MFDRLILVLFLVFVSLNGLDILTTVIGLRLGAKEDSLRMLQLFDRFGLFNAMLIKFFLIFFVGLCLFVSLFVCP